MALNPTIVDRAEIETYLGLSSTVTDKDRALLEMLRQQVENLVRRFCGHNITQPTAAYTEFHPRYERTTYETAPYINVTDDAVQMAFAAPDGDTLYLRQMFVRSITSIYEDTAAVFGQGSGDFPASTLLTPGTDYYLLYDEGASLSRSGIVRRMSGNWSSAPGTIKATYTAGLTATELDTTYSDLKLAVLDEVAVRFRIAKSREGSVGSGVGLIESEWLADRYKVTYETKSITSINENTLSPGTMDKLQVGGYVRLVHVAI